MWLRDYLNLMGFFLIYFVGTNKLVKNKTKKKKKLIPENNSSIIDEVLLWLYSSQQINRNLHQQYGLIQYD